VGQLAKMEVQLAAPKTASQKQWCSYKKQAGNPQSQIDSCFFPTGSYTIPFTTQLIPKNK
jgi:hypothetical protein